VEKAMQQIFSKKLLARDIDAAARFSTAHNLDAITLDGDEANRKGSMQGGYHDDNRSRLAHVVAIRDARAEVRSLPCGLVLKL
jgi:structural maintenance of chromosome 3 (chondroitin sulfate proteoglycan 6)